jgi:hypothetical protein
MKLNFTFPFKNIWLTGWGGDTVELNHHHNNHAQKFAFDFIIVDSEKRPFKNSGRKN